MSAYTVEHADLDAATAASCWAAAEPTELGIYDAVTAYATYGEERQLPHLDVVAVIR